MNLAPIVLEHGERFGQLTVLKRIRTQKGKTKYRVGCTCGNSSNFVRATQLMRGVLNCCARCRSGRNDVKRNHE